LLRISPTSTLFPYTTLFRSIIVGGKHFTSYVYTENLKKPVLYPIKTADGALVTRGFPLKNRPFERTDHPHHIGLWLNYGDVNGLDRKSTRLNSSHVKISYAV